MHLDIICNAVPKRQSGSATGEVGRSVCEKLTPVRDFSCVVRGKLPVRPDRSVDFAVQARLTTNPGTLALRLPVTWISNDSLSCTSCTAACPLRILCRGNGKEKIPTPYTGRDYHSSSVGGRAASKKAAVKTLHNPALSMPIILVLPFR
jgi:hypothetical protein